MTTQTTDNQNASRCIAVAGDDRLIGELRLLLRDTGVTLVMADDAAALASACEIGAGLELSTTSGGEKKERLLLLDTLLPPATPIISACVTVTAALQASWMRHPERLVGWGAFPGLMDGPLAETAVPLHTRASIVASARELLAVFGKEMVIVQDRVGMIFPAIIAQVVNEALIAVRQNVASAEHVDKAMKLGAGYPLGPIEWGERIGFALIAELLEAMRDETGDDRFRVAPLLRQLAVVGKFWKERTVVPEPVQEELALGDPTADGSAKARKKQKRPKKSATAVQPDAATDAAPEAPPEAEAEVHAEDISDISSTFS